MNPTFSTLDQSNGQHLIQFDANNLKSSLNKMITNKPDEHHFMLKGNLPCFTLPGRPPPDFPLALPLVHPNLPSFYPNLVASYRVRDTPVNLPLLLLSYWKKEGDDFRVRVVAKASSTIYNLRILSKVKKHFFTIL